MIYMFLHREGVLRPNQFIKGLFSTCAPHYLLSRCLYDISQTYMEDSGRPNTDPFTYAVTGRVFILLSLQAAGGCCCCCCCCCCCHMLTSALAAQCVTDGYFACCGQPFHAIPCSLCKGSKLCCVCKSALPMCHSCLHHSPSQILFWRISQYRKLGRCKGETWLFPNRLSCLIWYTIEYSHDH